MAIDLGDTTYRNRLLRYLQENSIKLEKQLELLQGMAEKTNEEKEAIAKGLLDRILSGEISFSESDHRGISPEEYRDFIAPIMEVLESLPDGTRVSTEQLADMAGLEFPPYQSSMLHHIHCLLMYYDQMNGQILEKPDDDLAYDGLLEKQKYTVRHRPRQACK